MSPRHFVPFIADDIRLTPAYNLAARNKIADLGSGMSDVTDLRAFVRVIERGGFAAASKDLGITPSGVSKLVTRLEDRLGVRLLHRTTRRLALTPEGETFHLRARDILAAMQIPRPWRTRIPTGFRTAFQ